jgi:hypothetical protein
MESGLIILSKPGLSNEMRGKNRKWASGWKKFDFVLYIQVK